MDKRDFSVTGNNEEAAIYYRGSFVDCVKAGNTSANFAKGNAEVERILKGDFDAKNETLRVNVLCVEREHLETVKANLVFLTNNAKG